MSSAASLLYRRNSLNQAAFAERQRREIAASDRDAQLSGHRTGYQAASGRWKVTTLDGSIKYAESLTSGSIPLNQRVNIGQTRSRNLSINAVPAS